MDLWLSPSHEGNPFWDDFLNNPPIVAFTASRSGKRMNPKIMTVMLVVCLFLNVGWSKSESSKFLKKARKITRKTKIELDRHTGYERTVSPDKMIRKRGPNRGASFRLSSGRVKLSGTSGQDSFSRRDHINISVMAFFDDWADIQTAYSEGREFKVKLIDKDVDCYSYGDCAHFESFFIELSIEEANEFAKREIVEFKLLGSRDSMIIEIPGFYFLGFMNALPERQAKGR